MSDRVKMVDREVLGHAIVEVLTLDRILVFIEPVHGVPPGLTLIGRHNVVGLADLAGDVVLGPGAGVVGSVETTLAGATRWEDAACQVQLDQLVLDLDAPSLYDPHGHPELGGLPGHDVLDSLL